jgi:hypothetical protein
MLRVAPSIAIHGVEAATAADDALLPIFLTIATTLITKVFPIGAGEYERLAFGCIKDRPGIDK